MPLDVKFTEHHDYLHFQVSGTYDIDSSIGRFSDVFVACELTGKELVLIDFRELDGAPAASEKIIYAIEIIELCRNFSSRTGLEPKLAYLGSPPYVSSYEPGVEIVNEIEFPAALFTDELEARQWLGLNM